MDETIDTLMVSVRADTSAFARDVSAMKSELEGPLVKGAGRAGQLIDNALAKAIRTGTIGFDELKNVALRAMADIAQASLRSLFSGGGNGGGVGASLINGLGGLVSSALGLPGRATGGPVSAGRPYVVGERGPELFVPNGGGRIEQLGGGGRDVRVAIAISAPQPGDPQVMRQSSRQVARAIRSALRDTR